MIINLGDTLVSPELKGKSTNIFFYIKGILLLCRNLHLLDGLCKSRENNPDDVIAMSSGLYLAWDWRLQTVNGQPALQTRGVGQGLT